MNNSANFETERRMAREFPRDIDDSLAGVLAACSDPDLVQIGVYVYLDDGEVKTGAGIRLAEAIAQAWGNLKSGIEVLARSNGSSDCRAYAYDLQSGTSDEKLFNVQHVRFGRALTDDRDLYELVQGSGARYKRACILAVVPGYVTRAALAQIEQTAVADTEATGENIVRVSDALAKHGVSVAHMSKRIGRVDTGWTPADLLLLRRIANSLDERMTRPWDWFDIERPKPGAPKSLAEIVAAGEQKAAAPAKAPTSTRRKK